MPRKGKLPPSKTDESMAFRVLAFHSSGAREEDRSIPVRLATNKPVRVWDSERGQIVEEYLLMSGADLPAQVVMVDSHDHSTVRNIFGSIRELVVNGDAVDGRAYFADKPDARQAFNDARDGHLTDISVGAFRNQERYLASDKTERHEGMQVKGPARLVTRWKPFEGSPVTVGADRHSTFGRIPALRAYFQPEQMEEEAMTEAFRSHLVSLGMPEDCTDEVKWAQDNLSRKQAPLPVAKLQAEPIKEVTAPDLEAIRKEAVEKERTRGITIRKAVADAALDVTFADNLISEQVDTGTAALRIVEELAKRRKPAGNITPTKSEHESFRSCVLDGFSQRIGAPVEKPVAGSQEFRRTRFVDLAKRCLEFEGLNTRNMDEKEVLSRAFAIGHTTRASDGAAYLTSGNFSNLLLDAHNKSAMKSFERYPSTYQYWCGMGQSVPDFKNINRVRLGEIGNQPTVEENGDYKDMSMSDQKESYTVEKRGSLLSLTYEAMRNDDLGEFSKNVNKQSSAMKGTINRSVYQIFWDNAALSDGVALFHSSSHGANLVTSALSVTSLNVMYAAMALQTGLNSDVILGIVPRFLVVAPGIFGTAWQLLHAPADPAAGGSAAGNSNTVNIYGPGGSRSLALIEEPILAGNDTDSWYGIAGNEQVDTVELTFLQGEESPVFEQETAFVQDAVRFKIRQTWGVKALDYRGLYKSTG
jgi:hypothetical protein